MKAGWAALCALLLTGAGCAKFPDSQDDEESKRLVFTMVVEGEIDPNYVYLVAIKLSKDDNPTEEGPVPVIGPPWGNGFVAGGADVFIRWDPLSSPRFLIYRFRDQNLINFDPVGTPAAVEEVLPGASRIRFELDLSQISPTPEELPDLKTMLVNFLTMDRVPQGTDTSSKAWDALGDSRLPSEVDDFVIIPLDETGIFDNNRFNQIEVQGDTLDPDLDIVDWSIQIRTD